MATLTKGHTFASGDTVTATKLNDLVDSATIAAIQTADISDNQITTAKIVDANVTDAKLAATLDLSGKTVTLPNDSATTAVIADDAVTTAKILDANVTPAKLSQPLTLATAQSTTSGTSIDFTGIPSWVKRITVMFNGVSTTGSSLVIVQLGSSSFASSGYTGYYYLSTSYRGSLSSGFITNGIGGGSCAIYGSAVCCLSGSNKWNYSANITEPNVALGPTQCNGFVDLSGSLDRVRITSVNGTDTFDAGSVNIMYEG